MKLPRISWMFALAAILASAQETVKVVSKATDRTLKLPGELAPFEKVDLVARANGYITKIHVDRGSSVRKGQVLVELSAPELAAQIAEAEARVHSIEAQRAELQAREAAAQATYDRLKAASATAGAISGNELVQAEKSLEAAKAAVRTTGESIKTAQAAVTAQRELEAYLKIAAPFDATVTERLVHPGALAGPSTGPMLRLENNSRLRMIVPVPEAQVSSVTRGARLSFTVPAYPGQTFSGTVARISRTLDPATRTMPVELDVSNTAGALAPGMYPQVEWPLTKSAALLVPATAVVTTTERVFVIRVRNGKADWVTVRKGPAAPGDLVEVQGGIQAGDTVIKRATDEIRAGQTVR